MKRILLVIAMMSLCAILNAQTPTLPEQANSAFQQKDWPKAVELYQQIVATDSTNGRMWYRLGASYYGQKKFNQAAEAYMHSVRIGHNPFVMYNMACSFALMGEKEKAIHWLQSAAEGGFAQDGTILTDSDLASLHNDSRFDQIVAQIKVNAHPCAADSSHQQFQFWVGEWTVYNTDGTHVGDSKIQLLLDGCLILENWTGLSGSTGKSMNFYNPETGHWQQTWVSARGNIIEYIGDYANNKMVYYATVQDNDGNPEQNRLTFFNLAPDSVRQFSQRSADGGKTWSTEYDLMYVRKPEMDK